MILYHNIRRKEMEMKEKILKLMKNIIIHTGETVAGGSCSIPMIYEPKIPDELKKEIQRNRKRK